MRMPHWLRWLLDVDAMDRARAELESRQLDTVPPLSTLEVEAARRLDVVVDTANPGATRERLERRRRHRLRDDDSTNVLPLIGTPPPGFPSADPAPRSPWHRRDQGRYDSEGRALPTRSNPGGGPV